MPPNNEMFYLPVPRNLYAEVVGFIAGRLGGHGGQAATDTTDPTEPTGPAGTTTGTTETIAPEFDEALVRRMYGESFDTHRQLMKVLAAHAGEWVNYVDISKEMGFGNPRQLPGTLGAFGRRAIHRYDGRWPFDAEKRNNEWHARMEPRVAEIIDEL